MTFQQLQSALVVLLLFLPYLQMLPSLVLKSLEFPERSNQPFIRCLPQSTDVYVYIENVESLILSKWLSVPFGKTNQESHCLKQIHSFKNCISSVRSGAPHWSTGFRVHAVLGVTTALSSLYISIRSWGLGTMATNGSILKRRLFS